MPNAFDTLQRTGSGGDSFVFDRFGDWLDMTITGYKDQDMSKAQDGSEVVLIVMGFANGAVRNGVPQQPGPVSLIAGGDKGRKLFEAAQNAHAPDLEYGTRFVMVYTSDRKVPNQQQPMKLYDVPTYERPQTGAVAGMAQQYGQQPPAPPQGPSYPTPQAPPGYPQQPMPQAPQGPPPGQWQPPAPPVQYPAAQAPQGPPPGQYGPDGQQMPLEWQPQAAPPPPPGAGQPQPQQPPQGYAPPQAPPTAPQAPAADPAALFPAGWGSGQQ